MVSFLRFVAAALLISSVSGTGVRPRDAQYRDVNRPREYVDMLLRREISSIIDRLEARSSGSSRPSSGQSTGRRFNIDDPPVSPAPTDPLPLTPDQFVNEPSPALQLPPPPIPDKPLPPLPGQGMSTILEEQGTDKGGPGKTTKKKKKTTKLERLLSLGTQRKKNNLDELATGAEMNLAQIAQTMEPRKDYVKRFKSLFEHDRTSKKDPQRRGSAPAAAGAPQSGHQNDGEKKKARAR